MASHLEDAEKEMKIDMTPMIDVVFLLIIFFLCIDFKKLEAKLPAYLPKDKGSQPFEAEPVEQLIVRIEERNWGTMVDRKNISRQITKAEARATKTNFALIGHEVIWKVGAKPYDDINILKADLKKVADDPARRVPDKDNPGSKKVMSVVIEPQPGTCYEDVAKTVDVIAAAGFDEITFGGGRGTR